MVSRSKTRRASANRKAIYPAAIDRATITFSTEQILARRLFPAERYINVKSTYGPTSAINGDVAT